MREHPNVTSIDLVHATATFDDGSVGAIKTMYDRFGDETDDLVEVVTAVVVVEPKTYYTIIIHSPPTMTVH